MKITTTRGQAIITITAEQRVGAVRHSFSAYAATNADDKILRLARTIVIATMCSMVSKANQPGVTN